MASKEEIIQGEAIMKEWEKLGDEERKVFQEFLDEYDVK